MKSDYDLIVIGGGAAGLVASTSAAGLGAKTALIEKNKLGGDCTWYGCIPSKTLIKSAQIFSLIKKAGDFGINCTGGCRPDGVMEHVRRKISQVSGHHPEEVFRQRGIDVLSGSPRFSGPREIELGGKAVRAKRFIICTGSVPLVPAIPGLGEAGYLTNENIFDLQVLPKSLAVLGGGPIGIELSQAFCRLGVEVFIIEPAGRLLSREDEEASALLISSLKEEGIKIFCPSRAVKFSRQEDLVTIELEDSGNMRQEIKAEKILVAAGRAANVSGLDLEKAGVEYSAKGIRVDETLKTTAKGIYACGDAAGPYQFSHMAEYQAVIASGNALLPFKRKVDYSCVPWGIFSDPELAHLGLTEDEARKKYSRVKVYRSGYAQNDRAVTDNQEKGLVKVVCDGRNYILGAHIAGAGAAEIIHEYALAMSMKLKLKQISRSIHIYPTLSQSVKKTADQYYLDIFASPVFKRITSFLTRFLR